MLGIAMALPAPAAAQTSWTGGSGVNGFNWYDGANWSGGVPAAATDAYIVVTPLIDMPIVNGSTASAANVHVGHDFFAVGDGSLIIQNGGILNAQIGFIDHNASPAKTNGVFVSGSGSQWNNTQLIVGDNHFGYLQITNGGAVTSLLDSGTGLSATGEGEAVISGAGSKWTIVNGDMHVGDAGTGVLKIAEGGAVEVKSGTGTVHVGEQSGSFGGIAIGGYANDPAEGAGTLLAGQITFGAGTGTLLFNHTDTGYGFVTGLAGGGTVLHLAGETIYTGNGAGFTGQTGILGGQFHLNGVLNGTVSVGNGGTLAGAGTAGTLSLQTGGTLAPGNSIGTLSVAGATFEAGSVYKVELNDGGFASGINNDLLNAAGSVKINGGTVHVAPANGMDDGTTYLPGSYTVIAAAGGVTGTFDTLTDTFAYLDFTLDHRPNQVDLISQLTAGSFCLPGMTANQCAAGNGAFSLSSGTLFNAVAALSNSAAPNALDQLSGEVHASTRTALLEDSRFPREAVRDRLWIAFDSERAVEGGSGGPALWGRGFGAGGAWNGDGNAARPERRIGGGFLGGDMQAWKDVRLGLMGGYSRSSFSIDGRSSSGTADTYTLGLYGGGQWNAFALTGGVAHSWHRLETARTVAFPGFSDTLDAVYDARTLQGWGEVTYRLDAGRVRFEPFANLAHVSLSADGFTETGGAAALAGAAQSTSATFTTLGLRGETRVGLAGAEATLSGMVGWRHAFGDTPSAGLRFASGGDAFTVAGVPLGRDALVLEAGFDLELSETATFGIAYGGRFGSGIKDHSANLSLNMRF